MWRLLDTHSDRQNNNPRRQRLISFQEFMGGKLQTEETWQIVQQLYISYREIQGTGRQPTGGTSQQGDGTGGDGDDGEDEEEVEEQPP